MNFLRNITIQFFIKQMFGLRIDMKTELKHEKNQSQLFLHQILMGK